MACETYRAGKMPLVSVGMLVYNHEKWLVQAIESVLMQETDFRFEVIIGEDCSRDGSREIVKRYQRMYPDRIVALLNEHNLGMQGNSDHVWSHANGKYVACCEGDDYWTDPHKLQKQVEFMEAHPEYSAIFHSTEIVDADGNPLKLDNTGFIYGEDSDLSWDAASHMSMGGQAASGLGRNPKYYADPQLLAENTRLQVLHGDHKGTLLYLSYGKIRRCHVPVSAYRRTYEGSSFNATSKEQDLHYYNYVGLLETARYLNLFAPVQLDNRPRAYHVLWDFWRNFFDEKKGKLKNIKIMIAYHPALFFQFISRMLLLCFIGRRFRHAWLLASFRKHKILLDDYRGASYAIFGMGVAGRQCMEFFRRMGWWQQVKVIWDNDSGRHGKIWMDVPVLLPGEGTSAVDVVLIASRKYLDEMKLQAQVLLQGKPTQIKGYDEWIKELIGKVLPHSLMLRMMHSLLKYRLQEFGYR